MKLCLFILISTFAFKPVYADFACGEGLEVGFTFKGGGEFANPLAAKAIFAMEFKSFAILLENKSDSTYRMIEDDHIAYVGMERGVDLQAACLERAKADKSVTCPGASSVIHSFAVNNNPDVILKLSCEQNCEPSNAIDHIKSLYMDKGNRMKAAGMVLVAKRPFEQSCEPTGSIIANPAAVQN